MKKIFLAFLTLVCAAACMLALASCGDKTAEEIISEYLANNTTEAPATTAAPDDATPAEPEPQVNETQWAVALATPSFANVTFATKSSPNGIEVIIETKVDLLNNRIYTEGYQFGRTILTNDDGSETASDYVVTKMQMIVAKVEDHYYYFFRTENGEWNRTEWTEEEYQGRFPGLTAATTLPATFVGLGSQFTYNEEAKAYIADTVSFNYAGQEVVLKNTTLKFANGRLVALDTTQMMGEEEFSMSYTFYDYGTTTVTLPTEFTDATAPNIKPDPAASLTENTDFKSLKSDQVNEAEWLAAFTDGAFANSTIKHTNEHYARVAYRKAEMDRKDPKVYVIMTQKDVNYEMWFRVLDGTTVEGYMPMNGTVYRETRDLKEAEANMAFTLILPSFADYYDQFTYDADLGAYLYHGTGLEANSPFEPGWTMTFSDVTIKFAGTRIAYISCVRNDISDPDGLYEFFVYDYGTTTVDLPTEYTDATAPQKPKDPLAGNTYTFQSIKCDEWDKETLEMQEKYNQGAQLVFGEDGSVQIIIGGIIEYGTYTLESNGIDFHMTITSVTSNGEPVDGFQEAKGDGSFRDGNVIMYTESDVGNGEIYHVTFTFVYTK